MNYIFYFFVDLHRTNVHLITSKINANGWHEIPRVTLENENGIVFFCGILFVLLDIWNICEFWCENVCRRQTTLNC